MIIIKCAESFFSGTINMWEKELLKQMSSPIMGLIVLGCSCLRRMRSGPKSGLEKLLCERILRVLALLLYIVQTVGELILERRLEHQN